jgi:hypothetical protein
MKTLFRSFFSKRFQEAHDAFESYSKIHEAISKNILTYESEIEQKINEMEEEKRMRSSDINFKTKEYEMFYDDIEALMITNIKEKNAELNDIGWDLDDIINNFVTKTGEKKCLVEFANKLSKHTIIDFDPVFIENEKLELVQFPELNKEDDLVYVTDMINLLNDIQHARNSIEITNKALDKLSKDDPMYKAFESIKELNLSNLSTAEVDFLREVKKTKVKVDKTLNFLELPTDESMETVFVHAYLRKLVDFEILHSRFAFKRYTSSIPEFMNEYIDKIGFFVLDEECSKIVMSRKKEVA